MAWLWRWHPWLTGVGTIIVVLLAVGVPFFALGPVFFEWPGTPAEFGVEATFVELACLYALTVGAPLVGGIGGTLAGAVALRAGWSLLAAIPLGLVAVALVIVNSLQLAYMTLYFL